MSKRILTLALALVLALGIFAVPAFAAFNASTWAQPELETAQSYGLIPDVLKDADLKQPITRAEFAAVAVKAYENFTGTTVTPIAANPFTDTSNADVLKAYNINLVNGTSATTYNPNGQLTRQDAATMMTRVEKKAYIPGWTLATDGNYTLNFTQPTRFADDSGISGYAKDSVYFMNAKGVINGTGNNNFSPTVTATREQAIIIALRMVEKLKGKALDYSGGTTQPPETTQPPSGSNSIIGTWLHGDQTAISWTYAEWTDENTFTIRDHVAIMFVFRADGTYLRRFRAYNNFGDTFLDHTGKYRVEGNKIVVFDRVETCIDFYYPEESYSNKALAGEYTYYYQHTETGYGATATAALFIETSVEALSNTNWYYEKH
jgi:hypothetical protein